MNPCSLWMVGALALGVALAEPQFQFGQQPIGSSNLGPIPGQRAPQNERNGRQNGQQAAQGRRNRGGQQQQQEREPFDLDRDVAPILVSQMMGDAVRAAVSPFASDASLVIRITAVSYTHLTLPTILRV